MNCCACLLLYTLLLSCSDACGLRVGMSPGPAFGRITSQNNLFNGIASGIGPGPHQCSHRKTKGTVLSNGLSKHHCLLGLGFRRWLCRAQLHHKRHPMKSAFPSTDGASQVGCSPVPSNHPFSVGTETPIVSAISGIC